MVNRRPAIWRDTERVPPVFPSTVSSIARLPLPLALDSATHGAGLDAFHAQLAAVAIETCTRPPCAATCAELRSRSKRQGAGSWLTVMRAPLMTIAPERATAASFAATATVT
jgi:hypothetical protein